MLIGRTATAVNADPPSTASAKGTADTQHPGPILLLKAARHALRAELLPLLDAGEAADVCRLLERALGIVERDLAAQAEGAGEAQAEAMLAHLRVLYGDSMVDAAGNDLPSRAEAMERRLTGDIRDGTLDGACAQGVRQLLFERTQSRLATTSPDYLARACGKCEGSEPAPE